MNLNYKGSVAERFMKFRSSLSTVEELNENLWDSISIFIPKSLATRQFVAEAYDGSAVTADDCAVITVTVDNYTKVLESTGALYAQFLPIFNDGTNFSVTLYCIVFDDTGFTPTVGASGVSWSPLTKAFRELYFISYFKWLFSEHYDGSEVTHDPAEEGDYDDSNFFDMALCLATLCESETTLSMFLNEVHVNIFAEGGVDTNVTKLLSHTKADEVAHCVTLTGSTKADRAEYFWGYMNLIGGKRSFMAVHNGNLMIPIVLALWFTQSNVSGEHVGNKLEKIRLTGDKVKPTGLPSRLDAEVNTNVGEYIYGKLDAKHIAYFISIDASSRNNAEMISDRTVSNVPITADMISKWIDYTTSQDIANFRDSLQTLTDPVLCNEDTYERIKSILRNNVYKYAGTNRVTNIQFNFPPFSEVKKGNNLEGLLVWSAVYVDDLGSVTMTGSVSF